MLLLLLLLDTRTRTHPLRPTTICCTADPADPAPPAMHSLHCNSQHTAHTYTRHGRQTHMHAALVYTHAHTIRCNHPLEGFSTSRIPSVAHTDSYTQPHTVQHHRTRVCMGVPADAVLVFPAFPVVLTRSLALALARALPQHRITRTRYTVHTHTLSHRNWRTSGCEG